MKTTATNDSGHVAGGMKTKDLKDALNRDISVLFSKGDLAEAERIRTAIKYIDALDELVRVHAAIQLAGPDLVKALQALLDRYHVMGCGDGIEALAARAALRKAGVK